MTDRPLLRIGSRGSPLALIQAEEVKARLRAAHPELQEDGAITIEVIKTSGDRLREQSLAELGGKGLFTKEIEEALLAKRIDIAVHSMKDMLAWLPDGLAVPCILPREDPRDALIALEARALADLPEGARVGTASPRRAAQLLLRRPDLEIVSLRGNVQTRLRKIKDGVADATLLALAGLKRLGLEAEASVVLEPDEMLPAVAQGAIGVECRAHDGPVAAYLEPLNDLDSWWCVAAERSLLAALGGSCKTPIAGLARLEGADEIRLDALIVKPDGSAYHRAHRKGARDEGARLGAEAGLGLKGQAGEGFVEV